MKLSQAYSLLFVSRKLMMVSYYFLTNLQLLNVVYVDLKHENCLIQINELSKKFFLYSTNSFRG